MDRIGVRELQQHASRWLREVQAGTSFEVTDRGQPVAMLVPIPQKRGFEALRARGLVTEATGNLLDLPPAPPAPPGARPLSEIVIEMRGEDER